jgi:putative ABC transport system substrate-binding protein
VLIRMLGLIAATVCLAASAPALAQPPSKIPRIGMLWQTLPPPPTHPHLPLLLKGLQDLGWEEGRTLAIEHRHGGNDAARLAKLAGELVRLMVDVITTAGDLSTRAAQQATTSIPIVALESGFAKSLCARAAELPIQQPSRFELDVNLKAAREIGIEIPQSILMRASRVIE